GAPVEEKVDLRFSAAGDRRDFLKAGDTVDSFFERSGDGHEHLVNRHDSVIDADDDARKIRVGENRDGNAKGKISAYQRERYDQEQQWPRQPVEPRHIRFVRITRERRFRPKLHGSLLLALLAGFRFRGLVVLLVFARLVSRFFLLRTRS